MFWCVEALVSLVFRQCIYYVLLPEQSRDWLLLANPSGIFCLWSKKDTVIHMMRIIIIHSQTIHNVWYCYRLSNYHSIYIHCITIFKVAMPPNKSIHIFFHFCLKPFRLMPVCCHLWCCFFFIRKGVLKG